MARQSRKLIRCTFGKYSSSARLVSVAFLSRLSRQRTVRLAQVRHALSRPTASARMRTEKRHAEPPSEARGPGAAHARAEEGVFARRCAKGAPQRAHAPRGQSERRRLRSGHLAVNGPAKGFFRRP